MSAFYDLKHLLWLNAFYGLAPFMAERLLWLKRLLRLKRPLWLKRLLWLVPELVFSTQDLFWRLSVLPAAL